MGYTLTGALWDCVLGQLTNDQGALPPGLSVLGAKASDGCACPPGVSDLGSQSADLGVSQLGFRCVLGLLIWRSHSRV